MSNSVYRRSNEPPPSGPRFKLFRLKSQESCNFSLLGTIIHGFYTHWTGRTDPCTEPRENCEGCKKQAPQRWKGYLFAQRDDRCEEGFIELTPTAKTKLLDLVGGENFLRGSRVKILRGKGDKTALQMLLLRPFASEFSGVIMPDEVDPEETLRVLFEWRRPRPDGGAR